MDNSRKRKHSNYSFIEPLNKPNSSRSATQPPNLPLNPPKPLPLEVNVSIYSNPPKIQNFSFPENIIFYISKNPQNPKVYEKLIKICKYFYLKAQIITMFNAEFNHSLWQMPGKINGFQPSIGYFIRKPIIPETQKIWFYDTLSINNNFNIVCTPNECIASTLVKKIYRCDIIRLIFKNYILKFNDFKLLASSGTVVNLMLLSTILKNEDENEKIVPIEKIIEILPNLQEFEYSISNDEKGFCSITYETVENLFKIPHFSNLKNFAVYNIPETFEFEIFLRTCLNKFNKTFIYLRFAHSISEVYIERLRTFINNLLIENKLTTENRPPRIYFPGMSHKMFQELTELHSAWLQQKIQQSI